MVGTSCFAQKGSYYLGGQVGFSNSSKKVESNEENSSSSWSFSPEVGTFLTNNVQLGLGLSFTSDTYEQANTYSNKIKLFGAKVYSRYFFGEGSKAFRPYVGINVSVLPGTREDTNLRNIYYPDSNIYYPNSTKYDLFKFVASLNAGFAYALSPKVTMVGSLGVLGFDSTTEKSDRANSVKETTNRFSFDLNSLGNLFNVGLYVTL